MISKTIKRCIPLFIICVFFIACDNSDRSSIPDMPVSVRLNLSAEYNLFKAPLQYHTFEKRNVDGGVFNIGYGGVLVNINMESAYCAYDMTCPHEKDKNIKVYPNESGSTAVCTGCGSEFDLVYGLGQVSKGPSKEGLKRYRTTFQYNAGYTYLLVSQY